MGWPLKICSMLAMSASLGALGCGAEIDSSTATKRSAIAGGSASAAGSWPMVAWLDNGCSGVLVAPDLVLSAAHCGDATTLWLGDTFEIQVDDAARTARAIDAPVGSAHAIAECRSHPDSALASGNDIAWCRLTQPALAAEQLISPLPRCAHARIGDAAPFTLVGFGLDEAGTGPGMKRQVQATLRALGRELEIGDTTRGTCAGDSGSPAFVQLASAPASDWWLAGVLSSGIAGEACGAGYYVDLSSLLDWVEASSGRDLSPCAARDGSWAPSSSCRLAAIDRDGQAVAEPPELSALCGAAFHERDDSGCSLAARPRPGSGLCVVLLTASFCVRRWRRRSG